MGGALDPSAVGARHRHLVQLHLAALLFGGIGLFGKLVDLSPGALVLARSGIAAAFVLAVALIVGQGIGLRRRSDLAVFAVLGVILAVHWVAFFRSIQVSTVSIAVLTVATFPVFTTLLKAAVERRRPGRLDVLLALAALGGVALIVGNPDVGRADTQGVLWGVAASALFAVVTIVNERLVLGYAGHTVALYQYGIAALLLAPFFAADLGEVSGSSWIVLAVFGTVFTGVPHTLFISSMRVIPSPTASLAVSMEPVYGVALAWLVLAEAPGLRVLAGGAVVLIAVAIGSRAGAKHPSPAVLSDAGQSTTKVTARPRYPRPPSPTRIE
ncbi:MAG: DMT family transporter [Acidimicrobiia bacterium]|nr:DMT family transporter [Acidimicrobiia bacterium]